MKPTEQIVTEVREAFNESSPNGIILGWDVNRYFQALNNLCSNFEITNNTDFNYSYCNSYNIEPRDSMGENSSVVTLKASFIADVYSIHVTKYTRDRRHGIVVPENEYGDLTSVVEVIRRYIEKRGFQEIGGTEHDLVIDDISLELSTVATLGKCLFDDFE